MIDGGAVSWSMKKQEIISLSTMEAEYMAATHAAKEALWLRTFINQVFGENIEKPTTLFSDNQSAITLSKDHQYHARTKHIDVCFHFIQWVIEEGKVKLIYCPTNDMLADPFTKALLSAKGKHFAAALGLTRGLRGSVEVTAILMRHVWDALLMRVLFLEARLAFLGRYAHFGRELCMSGKWILDSNCIVAVGKAAAQDAVLSE